MHHTDKYSQHRSTIWLVWLNGWITRFKPSVFWISLLSLKLQIWHLLRARSSLAFRQAIECGFILNLVGDMIITYSQMHHIDRYSQHSSVIWPVWVNGWVFNYKLSVCGFESCCYHGRKYFELSYSLRCFFRKS